MRHFYLFFLLSARVAAAQQDLLMDTAEVVVITAQRKQVSSFQLAESVAVLTRQELERQAARSTPEALIGMPGVWMQKTNHGGGSPFLRGLTGNQTLLLLDGIRLNNSTYRYGPNQYFNTLSVLNIEQVEVVRGSGSVLYGSDAIGGTINVLTPDPEFSEDHRQVKAQALGRMMSQGMEKTVGGRLDWSAQNIAFYANYNYRDFGDLVAGGTLGKEPPSAYLEQSAAAKIKAKLGRRSVLTLAYDGVFQSEVGRYDQVAQRGYQVYEFDPQNRQLAYLKGQTGTENALWRKIEWTASWQNSDEGRNKLRDSSSLWQREEDKVTTFGLSLEVHSDLGRGLGLVSGVEAYWDRIGSTAYDEDLSSGHREDKRGLYPDDSRASNLAFYSALTAEIKKWRLSGGLRYNFFRLRPNDENFGEAVLSPNALVGHLSAHYTLADKHALIASVSTAFRAPNINDLSSFGPFDFGLEVPSPGLKPEKSLNLELGYKFQNDRIRAGLALYRMRLFDLISRIRGTYQGQPVWDGEDVYIKANTSSAYIQGVEWDSRWWVHPSVALKTVLTYTYGQNVSGDEPMRRIPPLNGSLAVQYRAGRSWFLEWENWYAARQGRLSGGDVSDHRISGDGTPGWWVSNINVGFEKGWLQLNGGVQNLFNEAYRIHGSGVDGVGRSLWLSLRIRWERKFSR